MDSQQTATINPAAPVRSDPRGERRGAYIEPPVTTVYGETDAPAAGLSLDERFRQLVDEWQAGTAGLSSPRAIAGHPAYQEIIALGRPALPLIFRDLKDHGGWWYPALRALTGANPVPESARGNRALNDEAWLRWGAENGYA